MDHHAWSTTQPPIQTSATPLILHSFNNICVVLLIFSGLHTKELKALFVKGVGIAGKLMVKYIFVTGGVLSSVGKGILTSSIGKMLQARGLKPTVVKIDPYVNIDAGTMNPYMHGEVFVTDDGGETDLDLGWYERFLDVSLKQDNN